MPKEATSRKISTGFARYAVPFRLLPERNMAALWDYLIVTASNERQREAYSRQLQKRRDLGLLSLFRHVIALADPGGKRVGSGGSTLLCLMEVLNREGASWGPPREPEAWCRILSGLRILVVHAGGDSKRLPAYGPCGKIFVPLPGRCDGALPPTVFDRLLPLLARLPAQRGQTVVAGGDALILFDPQQVSFRKEGITALGFFATPQEASRHGVFCAAQDGTVRLFLQKPSLEDQRRFGAIGPEGKTLLDLAVMSFSCEAAVELLCAFEASVGPERRLGWPRRVQEEIMENGIDLYREICCALGSEATVEGHLAACRRSGSPWSDDHLRAMARRLAGIPFSVHVLSECLFLHFGTSLQLITSSRRLLAHDRCPIGENDPIVINSRIQGSDLLSGGPAWVEGCSVQAPLALQGANVVVGVEVTQPLRIPQGICLDVLPGQRRDGSSCSFLRVYGIYDQFKDTAGEGCTFCNIPFERWRDAMGAEPREVCPEGGPFSETTLWDARLFPALSRPDEVAGWLFLASPEDATEHQKSMWHGAEKYSLSEIAVLARHDPFHARRSLLRTESLNRAEILLPDSRLSARELAYLLRSAGDRTGFFQDILTAALQHADSLGDTPEGTLFASQILQTLSSAVNHLAAGLRRLRVEGLFPAVGAQLCGRAMEFLTTWGLSVSPAARVRPWVAQARKAALSLLRRCVLAVFSSSPQRLDFTHSQVGRRVRTTAPLVLPLCGAMTCLPPYAWCFGGKAVTANCAAGGILPAGVELAVVPERGLRVRFAGKTIELTGPEAGTTGFMRFLSPVRRSFELAGLLGAPSREENPSAPGDTFLWEGLKRSEKGFLLTVFDSPAGYDDFHLSVALAACLRGAFEAAAGNDTSWEALLASVAHRAHLEELLPLLLLRAALSAPALQEHSVSGNEIGPLRSCGLPQAGFLRWRAENSVFLLDTGAPSASMPFATWLSGRVLERDRWALSLLEAEVRCAGELARCLAEGDLEAFGRTLSEQQELHTLLGGRTVPPQLERLCAEAAPLLFGASVFCGRYLLCACRSAHAHKVIERLARKHFPEHNVRLLELSLSPTGSTTRVSPEGGRFF